MPSVEWVEPALTWTAQRKLNDLRLPRVLEIRSDNFMEDFLQAMGGDEPHSYLQSHLMTPSNGALKLFQPLHGCFYMVTASLVCRQIGLPDRDVARNRGESTGFVIRRIVGGVEYGWVNDGDTKGWNALDPKKPLVDDEELLPMHPLKVCTENTPGLEAYRLRGDCERVVYHGYLPAGNRDKYTASKKFTPAANQTNADVFGAYLAEIYNDDTSGKEDSDGGFRASEFDTRVIAPWNNYNTLVASPAAKDVERRKQAAFYIVVDLADFLKRALPEVWAANIRFYSGQPNPRAGLGGARLDLLDRLLNEDGQGAWDIVNTGSIGWAVYNVRDVLKDDSPYLLPVADSVPAAYDLGALPGDLKAKVIGALGETPATAMKVSNEFAELLREQVRVPTRETDARYFIRLVYDYDPDCPPILSMPSTDIQFARFFDGDAPSRKVRIEAPHIKDLRRFKPGVGIEMDQDLRDVLNRVHKGMKDGEALEGDSVNWELGMICTFSIQIIFLVAFIVMFIFLILLNIVFWWLPFLKICFPIPKPK